MKKKINILEFWNKMFYFVIVYFTILFVILIYFIVLKETIEYSQNKDIEANQKYNLVYACDWSAIGTYYVANYTYTNYSKYLEQLDFVKISNCKIIK